MKPISAAEHNAIRLLHSPLEPTGEKAWICDICGCTHLPSPGVRSFSCRHGGDWHEMRRVPPESISAGIRPVGELLVVYE